MTSLTDLIYFVTYRCNLRCGSCFFAGTMDKPDSGRRELDLDEIRKVSVSIGKLDKLLISGGEPLLRDDLAEICKIFHANNGIKYLHLPTNGFYADETYGCLQDIISSCPDLNIEVGLPLDGLKETHNKIKGVDGSFDKVLNTIEKISALKSRFKNLRIYIITVVNNANINEIIPLCEFIKKNLSVDGHGPSPMRGSPHDKGLRAPSHKEWDELSKKLIAYAKYWNDKNIGNAIKSLISTNRTRYMYNLYTRILKDGKLPFTCQAGHSIAVLEPDGDVRICELTKTVGNVRNAGYNLKAVLESDTAKDMMKRVRTCACTHACFLTSSMARRPDLILRSYFAW